MKMARQFILAVLLVAVVGVALFFGVSGLPYIGLVFSAGLLSLLFVRSTGREREDTNGTRGASTESSGALRL
jgi:hypothetical protein